MRSEDLRICLVAAMVLGLAACSPLPPVQVGVVFDNNWVLGPIALTAEEQGRFKTAAMSTLREAFSDFNVEFVAGGQLDRVIQLDRNLMRVGATSIGSKVSDVSLDGVNLTLLTVVGCRDIASCDGYSRSTLVDALGRGFGATAAHELGHQAGFRFVRDIDCADCWDGASAKNRQHFFGGKHWSPSAIAVMRWTLPRR